MGEERLLKVNEVAERLRINPATVRIWLKSGRLKGIYLGSDKIGWRIPERSVGEFLAARTLAEMVARVDRAVVEVADAYATEHGGEAERSQVANPGSGGAVWLIDLVTEGKTTRLVELLLWRPDGTLDTLPSSGYTLSFGGGNAIAPLADQQAFALQVGAKTGLQVVPGRAQP